MKRILLIIIFALLTVAAGAQIEINTAEDFLAIGNDARSLKGNYILKSDITVDNLTPVGAVGKPFLGVFNGDGHTITIAGFGEIDAPVANLKTTQEIPAVETCVIGLFGMIGRRASVQNLKVEGEINIEFPLEGNLIAGGIAGLNYGNILYCVSAVNINAVAGSGGDCIAGGITGLNQGLARHCYSTGNVRTEKGYNGYAGGIAGLNEHDAGIIQFSYSTGNISTVAQDESGYAGGIAGCNVSGGLIEVAVAMNGSIKADAAKGNFTGRITGANHGRAGALFSRKDIDLTAETVPLPDNRQHDYSNMQQEGWWAGSTRLINFAFGGSLRNPWVWNAADKSPALFWEGSESVTAGLQDARQQRATHTPAAVDTKEITTVEELAAIAADDFSLRMNYVLMNDLTVENWIPIGGEGANYRFTGSFDGNGHTITVNGIQPGATTSKGIIAFTNVGLFREIGKSGVVKNLRIAGDISYNSGVRSLHAGAVAGTNSGKILSCISTCNINVEGGKITTGRSFLTGMMGGAINAVFLFEHGAYTGGIVGINVGTVEDCYSSANVSITGGEGMKSAGGIAGGNGSSDGGIISRCITAGTIIASGDKGNRFAGGIAGMNCPNRGLVENCIALNDKLECIGKIRGVNFSISAKSNNAQGVLGDNVGVGSGMNYSTGKIAHCYYRKDMSVYCESDEEDKKDRNEGNAKGKGMEGKPVDIGDVQNVEWWTANPDRKFSFPLNGDSQWIWNDQYQCPVLVWELSEN
ncbi:MAG: hypothetical protein LBS54_05865 [Dysgonamonadaceae bacterium]|jgi:hypothetical protein|nr:hypothetical protein [Dysgonamonadaceae bacterium]